MANDDYKKFADITFADFQRMASDPALSPYEKIGFPNAYRAEKEPLIFSDIVAKLPALNGNNKVVLDIGPGCAGLPIMLADLCESQGHRLILVDSSEMLMHIADKPFIKKIAGYYPYCGGLQQHRSKVDVILTYSVLHYVFVESNVWDFLDQSLELLSDGGQMLIGDIPNISKRKRFFASNTGVRFHRQFVGDQTATPELMWGGMERGRIDDSVVMAIIMRARHQGFDAYVVPQAPDLPMANRREDILIIRP